LIAALDAELERIYGVEEDVYAVFNTVVADTVIVVEDDDGAALGCGCFRPHHEDVVELKRMYVTEAARGRGVGEAIVGALEAWARERGHAAVILETGILQPAAIRLYEKCGYARIPNFPPYDGMPNSICLTRRL
jgi:putative acetyltransferase